MKKKMGITKTELEEIKKITTRGNKDNISRTVFYQAYFKRNPEIKWAFLASMVSRNAGWSMGDLRGEWFPKVLSDEQITTLFLTYERANWTIFEDAFPQLLLYERSKQSNSSIMSALSEFNVSAFMQQEWDVFFESRDEERLMKALIINEQHVIERPVLYHHSYQKKVFHSFLFNVQEWFHFSTVLFPTRNGKLYGVTVKGFRHTKKRVELGKKLATLLFHPALFSSFYEFALKTPATGNRYDYEKYMGKRKEGPLLREAFPIVSHHQREKVEWFKGRRQISSMLSKEVHLPHTDDLTEWYQKKRSQLKIGIELENMIKPRG
ncbi:DUF2515 family protein [Guptibacillus algicola]|uniref:DUF2515 family protein n=1 Tax=Guptibacillus algicola TaxID=225844 RepID=UPI001CD5DEEA|nr:DUF2515 family protein [Alkalihalobacillus algicola]MCA0985739.1 DUF2515 domain-containing protein [Alkalihalobacillus algicola]